MTAKQMSPPDISIRALRPRFMIEGRTVIVGEVVTLPAHEARRLVEAGHAELVK